MAMKQMRGVMLRIITILVFLVLLCASSYALWSYTYKGSNNLIQKQAIEIEFLESSDVISLTNAVPISDKDGMIQSEAFDFQVRTKTKSNMSIGYNIVLEKVEIEDEYTVLSDNQVKIYLTDTNNKGLIDPTLVSDLEDYKIYKKYHRHDNVKEEVISKYRIRMWMDESVTGEGWDENTKIAYSFKLGVKAVEGETYDVVFNSNNGAGEEKVQHIAYNEELELEKNTFTKAGYRFIGWSTTSSGSVVYQDREKVLNLSGENESITLYAVWEVSIFDVEVVVQNGVIEDEVSKRVNYKEEETFKLKPNSVEAPATVSCTNNQVGNIKYNKLTVSDVTKDTVCTVVYAKDMTTLYSDGTLIINEYARDRKDNIEKHGSVTKEYEGMSESNSYVFDNAESQPWVNEQLLITNIELGQEISPVSTARWFRELRNVETGDFTKLDTSDVTSMYGMFYNVGYNKNELNLIGLDNFDTSKVTNMSNMFYGFASNVDTISVDLSNWDVSNITSISSMFNNFCLMGVNKCNLNLSNWNLEKATNLSYMFYNSGRDVIEYKVDLSNWNTSNVTNMNKLFMYSAASSTSKVLKVKGLDTWDVSNVTNMASMFENTGAYSGNWTIGNLSNWKTSKVKDMNRMFYYSGGRANIFNIGNVGNWNVSNVTNMNRMFDGAGYNALEWYIGDLSKWDVSNVTDMGVMFSLVAIKAETFDIGDLSNWNTSKVTNMERMFEETGIYVGTFKSIGTLNIPDSCKVDYFSYSDSATAGARKFVGNLVINGSLSSYENMLRDTATNSSARINLYYKNSTAEAIVDELISLYGPNGTVSKGNIYKVES